MADTERRKAEGPSGERVTRRAGDGAWRIGIDIGGTFTDAALVDGETGAIGVVKVLTTPEDPALGFMTALERGLAECQAAGGDVAAVVHATTVATNAIIEGKTARVGMLVTRGFRDILEIGRQIRSRLYDVHLQKPRAARAAPLEPRGRRAARPRGPRAGAARARRACGRRRGDCGTKASRRRRSASCIPI